MCLFVCSNLDMINVDLLHDRVVTVKRKKKRRAKKARVVRRQGLVYLLICFYFLY